MSFNQIADKSPFTSPIDLYKNGKFNNLRCNNITAGNLTPIPPPLINNQFLKVVGNTPTWVNFALNDVPSGPLHSVLRNDILGVSWSDTPTVNELDVLVRLESTNECELDNVNIGSVLRLNNVLPGPNQYVSTDGASNLVWSSGSSNPIRKAVYFAVANQDINPFVTFNINYSASSYNDLVAEVTQTTAQIFRIDVAGNYAISVDVSCLTSVSELEVSLTLNGATNLVTSIIGMTSNFCSINISRAFSINDLISVQTTRLGIDATPKILLNNAVNSPISFTLLD